MILHDPDATPFDLRFRLFGTHVRVHPLFWLMSVILGWNVTQHRQLSDSGMVELALWVGCVFFSILLHEFGHVWMGRLFGSEGHIVLHSMGGLAISSNDLPWRWQRILVSAAGPAIQLAFIGLLFLVGWRGAFRGASPALVFLLGQLVWINLIWPIFNLLPVWPLDGGQIAREVSTAVSPRNGLLASLYVSLVISAALAVNALLAEHRNGFLPWWFVPTGMWIAILFGMFAVGSWQGIQAIQQERRRVWDDDALPWER